MSTSNFDCSYVGWVERNSLRELRETHHPRFIFSMTYPRYKDKTGESRLRETHHYDIYHHETHHHKTHRHEAHHLSYQMSPTCHFDFLLISFILLIFLVCYNFFKFVMDLVMVTRDGGFRVTHFARSALPTLRKMILKNLTSLRLSCVNIQCF